MHISAIDGTTQIAVSLATYKAIEARRRSFSETHDAIIMRSIADRHAETATEQRAEEPAIATTPVRAPDPAKAPRRTRRRGRVTLRLFGRDHAALNLRDAYLTALTALVRHKSNLLMLLAHEGSEGRRWVAPTKEALFARSPHLARDHAHQLAPKWFVDTNVSATQIVARLRVASTLANCRYGHEVVLTIG